MRLLTINLLATAMLLFGAASASAWSVTLVDTGAKDGVLVAASDFITIDIYLDADPGLQLLSIGVMYDSTIMTYEGGLTTQPTYMLFSSAAGTQPATYLVPSQSPYQEWGGVPTVGGPGGQVNLNWQEVGLNPAPASGNGIWLGQLIFHVTGAAGDGVGEIYLSMTANGNILRVNDVVLPPSSTTLSPGIAVITPEPTTALLVGLGLIGLGVAGRRRA
jgi:hypothetical protein